MFQLFIILLIKTCLLIYLIFMSLLSEAYNYIKLELNSMYLLGFTLFCNICITLILSEIMVYISNGSIDLIPYYLGLSITPLIISFYIVNPLTFYLACSVKKQFIDNSITTYTIFNNKTPNIFWENCKTGSIALFTIVDWMLPSVFNMIGIFIDIIWIFYKKEIIHYFFIILIISISFYFGIIKRQQFRYNVFDKKKKNENTILNGMIQTELSPFNDIKIKELNNTIINNRIELNNVSNSMWGYTIIGNQIICILVSYFMMTDVPSFLLIIYCISKLNHLIINIYYHIIRYREIKNDYDNYIEFIKLNHDKLNHDKLNHDKLNHDKLNHDNSTQFIVNQPN